MNRGFWSGKRVLVTGHTGFKGAWLCLWLQRLGARVVGYALPPPTTPSLFELVGLASGMTSLTGDVRNLGRLAAALIEHDPQIVIHLAAQAVVRRSYRAPLETYSTNVMGTVNLLEAMRQLPGPRVVVNVTTDKCYENKEWIWGYREHDRLGGHDPYSNSKACSELVTAAYRDSYFSHADFARHRIAVATARAGNAIGGGDWTEDQLIPDLFRAFLDRRPMLIRNREAVRPWQFVLEPLRGYLQLAERLWDDGPDFARAWNFGPDHTDARPVAWIVDRVCELWGQGASWRPDPGEHPHETQCLKIDASLARQQLGWSPRLPLAPALEWVVAWYRAYAQGLDPREQTEQQIAAYEGLDDSSTTAMGHACGVTAGDGLARRRRREHRS